MATVAQRKSFKGKRRNVSALQESEFAGFAARERLSLDPFASTPIVIEPIDQLRQLLPSMCQQREVRSCHRVHGRACRLQALDCILAKLLGTRSRPFNQRFP